MTPTATPMLTDISVNLLHSQFADDREAVIRRARDAGVGRMLVTATDLEEAERAIAVCEAHRPGLWCTAGVHPHAAKNAAGDWQTRLSRIAQHPRVKAIGETGLDFFRDFSPRDTQQQVFAAQLAIAAQVGKPVFVHERDSAGAVGRALAEHAPLPAGVVVHCFTGSRHDLLSYLDAGYHIGITGWVCERKRGARLRELIPLIPLERLLVETDAPFLRPHNAPKSPSRRNEPALLPFVVARLAELYACTAAEIARVTSDNAARLFELAD